MMDNEEIRKIEIDNMNAVMSTTAGRNVLYRLLRCSGVDDGTFDADTHKHARNAGRREVGIELREEIKSICKDKYYLMIKENE